MQIQCRYSFIRFICMFFEFQNTDNVQFTNLLNTIWWAFRQLTQFSIIFHCLLSSTSIQSIWFDRFDVHETLNIRKNVFKCIFNQMKFDERKKNRVLKHKNNNKRRRLWWFGTNIELFDFEILKKCENYFWVL